MIRGPDRGQSGQISDVAIAQPREAIDQIQGGERGSHGGRVASVRGRREKGIMGNGHGNPLIKEAHTRVDQKAHLKKKVCFFFHLL